MIRSIDVKRAFTWEPIHKRRSQVDPDPEEVCTYTCTADARCDFKPCIDKVDGSRELRDMRIGKDVAGIVSAINEDPQWFVASSISSVEVRSGDRVLLRMDNDQTLARPFVGTVDIHNVPRFRA